MTTRSFVVGTRFFESNKEKAEASLERLKVFIVAALAAGAEKVLVAVNIAEDKSDALAGGLGFDPNRIKIFAVTPWGKFVPALNAILIEGREEFAKGAMFLSASVEVPLSASVVDALFKHMDDDTLVVGAAMEGHDFRPREMVRYASGRQVPWNTLALWNVKYFWVTGFPLIGDGSLADPTKAGVEECATIAIIQACDERIRATLVQVVGIVWNTSDFDATRRAKHEAKMDSKDRRARAQVKDADLVGPWVQHI